MPEIQIKRYEKGDEEEIIELLNKTFNGWHKHDNCSPVDYWRWKYLKNPFDDNFVTLALEGRKLIGCFHSIPQRIKIGENVYCSSTGTDLAVDQDYRNLGIYGKMRALQRSLEKESIAFHYGVSNNPILIAKNIKENHGELPYTPLTFVKIDDLELHIEKTGDVSFSQKYGFKVVKLFNELTKPKRNSEADNIKITRIDRFDERIDNFWDKISEQYNFIVERKVSYLNWRYCDAQCNDYSVLMAEEGGEITGYIVLKTLKIENGYQFGYVVDLIGTHVDAANALMEVAVNFFKEKDVNIVQWQITNDHPYASLAAEQGFVNSRKVHPLDYPTETARIGADETKLKQSRPDQIHFVFGDYDFA